MTFFTFWNILYLSNPRIVTYCQRVSLSQPQFEEHNFLLKFNIVIKDGRNTTFKHSNKRISDVAVTEFALVFQIKKMHLCSVQVTEFALVFQITKFFSVAVTELDFVFYNRTVRDISKNIKNQLNFKNFFTLASSQYSYF